MDLLISVDWSRGSLPANSSSTRAKKCLRCRTHHSNKGPRCSWTAQSFYNLPGKTVGVRRDRGHRETGFAKLGEKIVLDLQTQIWSVSIYSCINFSTTNPWTYFGTLANEAILTHNYSLETRLTWGGGSGARQGEWAWWKPSTCSTLKGRGKKKRSKHVESSVTQCTLLDPIGERRDGRSRGWKR